MLRLNFNIIMPSKSEFIEIQVTAETMTFSKETIDSLLYLAKKGTKQPFQIQ